MRNLFWVAAGIFVIAGSTVLSFVYESLWLGFFTALSSSIIILALMTWKMASEIQSGNIKKTITLLFLGLVVIHVYNSVYSWVKTQNQKKILTEIRQTIDGSIAQVEAEKMLIESLKYNFVQEQEMTLEEAFMAVAGNRVNEDGNIQFQDERIGEDLNFKAEFPQADSIVIHIDADIARGDDPAFVNISGNTGKYQATAILTSKGVHYVRQN